MQRAPAVIRKAVLDLRCGPDDDPDVSTPSTPRPTRRHALVVLGLAWPAGVACTATTDDDSAEPTPRGPGPLPSGPTEAGPVSLFPPGRFAIVEGQSFAVGHDPQGMWAVSLACTHLACDIGYDGNVSWDGIECPCHGSRFDRDGRVVRGPAVRALRNLFVSVEDGVVIVDTSMAVDLGTRIAAG